MNRVLNIQRLRSEEWDLVVIGGGASGLGVALDALSRGLKVALVEKSDFSKGTSSRSTKLIHGGVRYLAQGNLFLVREALQERDYLFKNAPHLVHAQSFIIPSYSLVEKAKYWLGLKIYDLLAGSSNIGSSSLKSKEEVQALLPPLKQTGLNGGIEYFDGQFDDARLTISLVRTCDDLGGCLVNYIKVYKLMKDEKGNVCGVKGRDEFSGESYKIRAKAVVNATGVFADKVLRLDKPDMAKTIRPSQGIHLVVKNCFLNSESALMIPKTSDGRVLFVVPWLDKLLIGTTDTLRKRVKMEPVALEREIDFILSTVGNYLSPPPTISDVQAVFAGLRPLAAPKEGSKKTKEISRSHKITVTESNLISVIGGKWTTFRKMGEDAVDHVIRVLGIKYPSKSKGIRLHGYLEGELNGCMAGYGTDADKIHELALENPEWADQLHPNYPYIKAQVVWAVREEMAHQVEDFLARRIRILMLDAKAAWEMAPEVASLMAVELGKDEEWIDKELKNFRKLVKKYLLN
jgi:glycerol-3-phosphate dehydrogenase